MFSSFYYSEWLFVCFAFVKSSLRPELALKPVSEDRS